MSLRQSRPGPRRDADRAPMGPTGVALGSDPVTSLWLGGWDHSPGVSLSLPPGEDSGDLSPPSGCKATPRPATSRGTRRRPASGQQRGLGQHMDGGGGGKQSVPCSCLSP